MEFIIFDLEATCWKDSFSPFPQEIIEIGACKLSNYGTLLDKYSKCIKPKNNPILSMYCRNLTNITQAEIDRASSFVDVMTDFEDWVYDSSDFVCFYSWGPKDFKLLEDDSLSNNYNLDWLDDVYDLKKQYNALKKSNKIVGFDRALELESIEFEGPKHRALSDAMNLSKIFERYIDHWRY